MAGVQYFICNFKPQYSSSLKKNELADCQIVAWGSQK